MGQPENKGGLNMAHDKQCKDSPLGDVRVKRSDYPKKGELFWNRHTHRYATAHKDMDEKFLIVEEGE